MTELFLQILNNSFSAVWVVLVVCAARLLLKKAPRSLVCGLWSLVGLRLILGGRLESPISLIPSAEIIPPASMYDRAPTIHSGLSSIDSAVNPIYSEVFKSDGFSSVNPLQVWTAVAANIWVIVAALILLWAVIGWLRIRQQVRESIPAEQGVFLCDRIDSPFILGLIRPKIYLPSNLDDSARDHVIAHERAHLRRLDHWWKPLGFALLTVNWFNPAMWLAYVLLCRDIEMSCDERVVRNLGMEEKKSYSNALLTCSSPRNLIAACPLAFGEVGVKQRIKSVLHYKKPALWVILISLALTAVLAACTLTDPIPTESVPTHTLPSLDTPSQNEETPLGIRLSAEHVTASGLTLVYTREGRAEDWVEIVTSPEWTLEKWVDGAWLDIMPENVGWGEVLY